MPTPRRFSIVLPVYNVRAYLRQCLDSILSQSFGDFELIAVDDASPDHSGAILDEYAKTDPRLRVIHLAKNVGLGLAREAGIAEATGEYLLFVDSDDYMTPGSLEAISRRIDETDRPDIVVFDYARKYWSRRTVRNRLAHLLAQTGPDVFTIDERPKLLTMLQVVWNKAYRRDFVVERELRFNPGYYEDTSWTYPALLSAKRIAVLDMVCVHYRMRREAGNILKSRSRKHFDIFDQWDLTWAYVDRHADLARWRPFLMRRELDHLTTILDKPRRLPASARREFFQHAHRDYLDHRPAEEIPLPGGLDGLKIRLVIRNQYLLYRALQMVIHVLGRARRIAGFAYRTARATARRAIRLSMRVYYLVQLRLPLDDKLAVYSAYWARNVSCNPYAIYLKARELVPDVRGVWVLRDPTADDVPPGIEAVRQDTWGYYRSLARAKYLINNANFPDFVRKRRGSIHLQTQHGTPLKKMGVELIEFPVGAAEMDFPMLLKRIDRWDFNISSNAYSTEVWERSNPAAFETLEVGLPRNDRLVLATEAEQQEIRAKLGIPPTAGRVLLYAPTFRDYRLGFDPEVDLSQVLDALGDDGVLLMRAHYFNGHNKLTAAAERERSQRMIDVSEYPSIEDLCIASDALLTDYSSIMFDYALLDRPIVIYAYDWDTYVRTRGVNFDLMAEPPGFVATTADELLSGLRSGEAWGEAAAKLRGEFRERFCQYDDGRASERVVRRVFLGQRLPADMESDSTSVTAAPAADDDSDREV